MSSEEQKKNQQPQKKNDLRDRMDRPEPRSDITEGDEDTIEESLRQHERREEEQKKRAA